MVKFCKLFSCMLLFSVVLFSLNISSPVSAAESGNVNPELPDQTVFTVYAKMDHISLYDWPLGDQVTVEIDGVYTSPAPILVEDNPFLIVPDYDIQPGSFIRVSGSEGSLFHTVTDITTTLINPTEDIVSGMSSYEGGIEIIFLSAGSYDCNKPAEFVNGIWTIDYDIAQPGDLCDIVPGSFWEIRQVGVDNPNATILGGYVNENPTFRYNRDDNMIDCHNWPIGTPVTLYVNNMYAAETDVGTAPWNEYETLLEMNLNGVIDLEIGDELKLTDGTSTKNLTYTGDINVTEIDIQEDIVSGTAIPDREVLVEINTNGYANRRVRSDAVTGEWQADFSQSSVDEFGQEVPAFDIGRNYAGNATVLDLEGDGERINWFTANTLFTVYAKADGIGLYDWPIGDEVIVDINVGAFISDPITVQSDPFNIGVDYDIQPGDIITITGNAGIFTHTVTDIKTTLINPTEDIVSGTSSYTGKIEFLHLSSGTMECNQIAEVVDGTWTVDYDTQPGDLCEIGPGSSWEIRQLDEEPENNNATILAGYVNENPTFRYFPEENRIEADNWPIGMSVTLLINDADTAADVDYSQTQTVQAAPWDENSTFLEIYLNDFYDVDPGDMLTLTDGTSFKALEITDSFHFTYLNINEDTVSGFAAPGAVIFVEVYGEVYANRTVTADPIIGEWTADFSEPVADGTWEEQQVVNLTSESTGVISLMDEDWDAETISWYFTNTLFTVFAEADHIGLYEWPIGDEVTVDINGVYFSPEPVQVLYDPFLIIPEYDIQAGDFITISGNAGTFTHLVTDVQTTIVDPIEDIVAGTTDNNDREITLIFLSSGDFSCNRTVTPLNGYWEVDFDITQAGDPCDIVPGSFGEIRQVDENENASIDAFYLSDLDSDGDGWPDDLDNAPENDNPDQSDLDGDGVGDVADPCPSLDPNTCNPNASAALSIDENGGELLTPDLSTRILIPAGALTGDISLSITGLDISGEYLLENGEVASAVYGVEIGPAGTQFALPVTVIMTWQDADNDGFVDSSGHPENELFISKDGVAVTEICSQNVNCDPLANTISVQVSSLSEFVLAAYVNRLTPEILFISGPEDPVQISVPVQLYTIVQDPNEGELFNIRVDWGDGFITEDFSTETILLSEHIYTDPGVYTLKIRITDRAGFWDEMSYSCIVVYDISAGFVTGGGWIISPEGAYLPAPELTGKATFGFVAKYKEKTYTPIGNTEFVLHVSDFKFQTTSYDWLVVDRYTQSAIYKGLGTVNGAGDYEFMVWAADADQDSLRIKIWEISDSGEKILVYDNGAFTNIPQQISGGNIIIHNK